MPYFPVIRCEVQAEGAVGVVEAAVVEAVVEAGVFQSRITLAVEIIYLV